MPTLFALRSILQGNYSGLAFTDYDLAQRLMEDDCLYDDYEIVPISLPFIGRNVYYIDAYYGYTRGVYPQEKDVREISRIYTSINKAKKDEIWKEILKYIKTRPEEYHVDNESIVSKEGSKLFNYGHVSLNKFNIQIKNISVIKRKGEYEALWTLDQ